jgi:isopentenyl diphosphate isomerase/L-lactate dehydrogenase-like FMN-dependent dehydrogenase
LDTWALAWRPADLDGAYIPFAAGIGNSIGFTDPVFREKFEKKYGAKPESKVVEASQEWIGDVFSVVAHTWEEIELLKKHWDGPIVLEGIQHPEDAKLAIKYGCDGIVVSNHGGASFWSVC